MATVAISSTPAHPPGHPWPVPEFALAANSSPRHIWRLISDGHIRVIRLGRKVLIADHEARRILAEGIPSGVSGV